MGLFWYIFLGFVLYYTYVYFTTKSLDTQQWDTLYILLAIGFVGWIMF
jgi:hypothetical protein